MPAWPSCATGAPDGLFREASRHIEAHALESGAARSFDGDCRRLGGRPTAGGECAVQADGTHSDWRRSS
ncbi:hypothetical protein CLOP_g6873 [Closterium sp. NIES-67]|nr:hypothetical protein CLOP_g6873 [Closterium sp. NIES-67]